MQMLPPPIPQPQNPSLGEMVMLTKITFSVNLSHVHKNNRIVTRLNYQCQEQDRVEET